MTDQLSPEQRAALCFPDNALCEFMSVHANRVRLSADAVTAIQDAIASAIRAAETAAVARCVETLRDMGMHETALMLSVTMEADNG